MLNVEISRDQEEYVLFRLTMEECLYQPRSVVRAIPLCRWADQPGNPHPIPDLRDSASLKDWLDWADSHDRGVRAAAMEWVLMDPDRGRVFCENIGRSPVFRSKFGGLFISITNALERLEVKNLPIPNFIQEKIVKVRAALKEAERLLGIMRAGVAAR